MGMHDKNTPEERTGPVSERLTPAGDVEALPTEHGAGTEPAPVPTGTEVPPSELLFVWSDRLVTAHDHPGKLQPARLQQGYRLLQASGALGWSEIRLIEPDESLRKAEALRAFHSNEYVQTVEALSQGSVSLWAGSAYGFSNEGIIPFAGMAEIAGAFVAAARTAVRAVAAGKAQRAVSLAAEQPHARPDRAQGGDIFNDVILALQDARAAFQRVAFLNLDAEHPTLVQEHFYQDPQMLVLSIHEGPAFLYPGTGRVQETGGGQAQGMNVNLPLPPGAGDVEFLLALDEVIAPIVARFEPDLLVIFGGGSAHVAEPLTHLRLTSHGYQQLMAKACTLAPRLVLLGGAGSRFDIMARLWALAVAVLAERAGALPRNLPTSYTRQWGEGTWHDSPLSRLPAEMRAYVTEFTSQTILQAQRLHFPRWELPIPQEPTSRYTELTTLSDPFALGQALDEVLPEMRTMPPGSEGLNGEGSGRTEPSRPDDGKKTRRPPRRRKGRGGGKNSRAAEGTAASSADSKEATGAKQDQGSPKSRRRAGGRAAKEESGAAENGAKRGRRRRRRRGGGK